MNIMRIVQTFWTAGRNPLEYSFGWLRPEYNLMSWALSCLSLREHYDEVALYTDEQGKHVLTDLLHLPYTEVHVVYDEYLCLPQHWAYAKIKTYSMQTKPFLHVDGDVYLPKPISEDIISSPLIAQNREIGTGYYKTMMDNIFAFPEITLPDYILDALQDNSILSYNMGIFGGSDTKFIHYYCQEAFRFLEENKMNDSSLKHSGVWCNILFEQIFFAVLAQRYSVQVECLTRPMMDEGYSGGEFCDFPRYEEKQLLHLLGGHKRVETNSEMMGQTLVRLYPDYLLRILSLFPDRHIRMSQWEKPQKIGLSVQMSLAQYEDMLDKKVIEWFDIPIKEMLEMEERTANHVFFERAEEQEREELELSCNPRIELFAIPSEWHKKAIRLLKQRLGCEPQYPLEHIALVPSLMKKGVREVPIVKFQLDIIDILKAHNNGMKWKDLYEKLMKGFFLKKETSRKGASRLVWDEFIYMIRKGLIILSKKYNYGNNKSEGFN